MVPTLPEGGTGTGSASHWFHSSLLITVRTISLCVETASVLSSQGARLSSDSRAVRIISFSLMPDRATLVASLPSSNSLSAPNPKPRVLQIRS